MLQSWLLYSRSLANNNHQSMIHTSNEYAYDKHSVSSCRRLLTRCIQVKHNREYWSMHSFTNINKQWNPTECLLATVYQRCEPAVHITYLAFEMSIDSELKSYSKARVMLLSGSLVDSLITSRFLWLAVYCSLCTKGWPTLCFYWVTSARCFRVLFVISALPLW